MEPQRPECILIADDLAGACDTGVQFVRRGLSCEVHTKSNSGFSLPAANVLAFNTDSRSDSAAVARGKIQEICGECSGAEPRVLLKKIDSTLRGNVGWEIAAMLECFRREYAIVAPAFPAMQRIVRGGMLQWTDCFGTGTVEILKLLEQQGIPPQAESISMPPSGRSDFASALRASVANGAKVVVVDCECQEDLHSLVTAAAALPAKPLWVGAAGLGMALAASWESRVSPSLATSTSSPSRGPVVFCIGSTHSVTSLQCEKLAANSNLFEVAPVPDNIESARAAVNEGRHLLLRIGRDPDAHLSINGFFAGVHGVHIGGVVMTGGDTGSIVCRALGATSIWLRGEISAGFPWGNLRGGIWDGLPVGMKSGGFGDDGALLRSAAFFAGGYEGLR
jgi:D-threonate/D-erythronate kinase